MLPYLAALRARFFRAPQTESEMEEELRAHVRFRADDLERSGLARAEAERRARIELGGETRFKDECRDALGGEFIASFIRNTRYALRVLGRSPGFTIVAVATLALAIGANSVVFSIVNALVLRPIAVPQGENLYATEYGIDTGFHSFPNYRDLRERNHSFEDLAAFSFLFASLDTGRNPSPATGFKTTVNYFDVLRVQPYLGRFFHPSDDHGLNSAPYLVLSYDYWHGHFQEDRGLIGRTITMNKRPRTIIGVAPPGFRGTLLFVSPDFFTPITNQDLVDGQNPLDARGTPALFETFGHLKPGVTPAFALADLKRVGADLTRAYPKEFAQKDYALSRAGLTSFGGPVRVFLAGLMLLAGLILLAACANLGALFAARASDRTRELALRLALGSSRGRLLRHLLTEAMLLSIAGAIAGLAGSIFLLERLSNWQPFPRAPIHIPVHADLRTLLFALAMAIFSGLLFGAVPVRQILRSNPYMMIKTGATGGRANRFTLRDALIVVQIGLCAILITSSLVAVRGLVRSLNADFGFDSRVMLAGTDLGLVGYLPDRVPGLQRRMIDALESVPGVDRVSMVNGCPPLAFAAATPANVFRADETDLGPANIAATPYRYSVSPGYFETAGTSLLSGRAFSWHDDANAPAVAVANREFARKMFGSVTGALGRYFKLQDGKRVQVVGVVEDGKYMSVAESPHPAVFVPCLQAPASQDYFLVRSRRAPAELAAAIRAKLHELDPELPVDTGTWASFLDVALFPSRVAVVALGVLGCIGAVLSITGIFGMAAFAVSRRMKDLGIRIALGAQRGEVLRTTLSKPVKLLAAGSAVGVALGILASRVLAAIVYAATPRDPLVWAGVLLVMAALGVAATWIPAHRALSIDPLRLLREE